MASDGDSAMWWQLLECRCQGTTYFLLPKHLRVFPTLTSDTFSILQTPTASEFWRHFGVLPIPSPFQQSPMLPHAPSTPTPCLTPPPMVALRPLPPPKVTWRPLQFPHPPIQTPLQRSLETLWAITELGWLPVRALARPDQFPFLSPFSLYGLSYCMPKLTSPISYCALS